MNDWLKWHLAPEAGPKRILALDGGGVRGLITLGILQRIEDQIKQRSPNPDTFRLCQYFDLIAGTSTGSIIATGLALGWSVAEVRKIYDALAPQIFEVQAKGVLKPIFGTAPIEKGLKSVLKDRDLQSPDLQTFLMICAKRIDTGSPWVLTNNPRSLYWDNTDGSFKPNKLYELWRVVRASTAAPLYFEPLEVVINDDPRWPREVGLFLDGAVAGLNNPSWQAMLTATLPPYGFGWPAGAGNIFVVSIGTGWWRMRHKITDFQSKMYAQQAGEALAAMVQDTSLHAMMSFQAMCEPRKPRYLNGEIKTLKGQSIIGGGGLVSYQRYDAEIDESALRKLSGMGNLDATALDALIQRMRALGTTDPDVMRTHYSLGYDVGTVRHPGADGIEAEDFPAQFDPPFMRPA